MKACIITHNYPRFQGDSYGLFIKFLAENLVDIGNNVDIVAAYDPRFDMAYAQQKDVRVKLFRYAFPARLHTLGYGEALQADGKLHRLSFLFAPVYFISCFFKLLVLSLREKYDVLNAHWAIPNGFIAAVVSRICGIPLAITLHGSGIFLAQRNPVFRLLARYALKRASIITACSEDLKNGAIHIGARPETVELVLWGVQPDIFKEQKEATAALRKRYDPEGDRLIILALGRMVYKKGFEYLIQAVPSIVSEFPQARVVFVGGGPLLSDMQHLAAELKVQDSIHFVGEVPWTQVPLYDQMCDIFVVPSILDHEGNLDGQPTIIAEAMVCSKPIVASRVAGIPLIIEDGINGLLVQEKSADELSKAIRKLLASAELRRKMGEANRKKVDTTLNWRNVAHTFDGFFRRMTATRDVS